MSIVNERKQYRRLREMTTKIFKRPHFKETPKLYTVHVYYRIFISALFHDIFWLEILSCPPILIIVDMHVALESRNHIFLRNNY